MWISKNNIKNRQKSLKDRWHEVYDIFIGLTKFAWNGSTGHFKAQDKVWDDLMKVMYTPLLNTSIIRN